MDMDAVDVLKSASFAIKDGTDRVVDIVEFGGTPDQEMVDRIRQAAERIVEVLSNDS